MPKIYFEEFFPELGCPTPTPASMSSPGWMRDIPRFYGYDPNADRNGGQKGSIRACPAVHDAVFAGYTLYLPADVYIDATENSVVFNHPNFLKGSRAIEAGFEYVVKHDAGATEGYKSMIEFHPESLKWQPFWGIKTDPGYSTLFIHPVHRNDLPFQMITAIVDTDTFPTRAPYAFFVRKGFKGTIPRGTPIMQVIPFKREDWESEIVEPDGLNHRKNIQLLSSVFTQPYKKIFWHRKKYK